MPLIEKVTESLLPVVPQEYIGGLDRRYRIPGIYKGVLDDTLKEIRTEDVWLQEFYKSLAKDSSHNLEIPIYMYRILSDASSELNISANEDLTSSGLPKTLYNLFVELTEDSYTSLLRQAEFIFSNENQELHNYLHQMIHTGKYERLQKQLMHEDTDFIYFLLHRSRLDIKNQIGYKKTA